MGAHELVRETKQPAPLNGFHPNAILFLRDGLDYTVRRVHGKRVHLVRRLHRWLHENNARIQDLADIAEQENLPKFLVAFIRRLGGLDQALSELNLHVGGEDLCRGLRDLALERYGLMAPAVLRHWGIRSTRDFGRIVFGLVEAGELARQDDDDISDFDNVFDFAAAFDRDFRIDLAARRADAEELVEDDASDDAPDSADPEESYDASDIFDDEESADDE